MLTIVDRTSRYLAAVPMEAPTSANCAAAFLEGWVQHFSVPAYATSDNAVYFTSRPWRDLHDKLGTIVSFSPLYRPQAVGMVERQHAQLKAGLRAALLTMGDKYGQNWADILPWILLGRRTSWHEELGATPAQLVFGTDPPLPGDALPLPTGETIQDILTRVQKETDRPPMTSTMQQEPYIYMPEKAKVCTHVYVKQSKVGPLTPKNKGPYKILERLGKSSLKLRAGYYANGTPRIEIRHWNTCYPADLAADAKEASRPALGRKKLAPAT